MDSLAEMPVMHQEMPGLAELGRLVKSKLQVEKLNQSRPSSKLAAIFAAASFSINFAVSSTLVKNLLRAKYVAANDIPLAMTKPTTGT